MRTTSSSSYRIGARWRALLLCPFAVGAAEAHADAFPWLHGHAVVERETAVPDRRRTDTDTASTRRETEWFAPIPRPATRPLTPGLALGSNSPVHERLSFPFNAAHLFDREYLSTGLHAIGAQGEGFDLGVMGWREDNADGGASSGGVWSGLKDSWDATRTPTPGNRDQRIYGLPVRAAAPGQVLACWRNAPENPRPFDPGLGDSFTVDGQELREDGSNRTPCADSSWLHPMLCARRMAGGGNHLWVRNDSGRLALYAHFKPDTIPEWLCPHDDALFETPDAGPVLPGLELGETPLPDPGGTSGSGMNGGPEGIPQTVVVNGARIETGDYLGEVGNSGSSSGPHLHIHVEENGTPVPIVFERGLSTYLDWPDAANDPAIDRHFHSFANTRVSRRSGSITLIWPPLSTHLPFEREGIEAAQLGGWLEHLADSGYTPGLITCEGAGDAFRYDLIGWSPPPSSYRWTVRYDLDDAALAAAIAEAETQGHAVISSYTCNTGTAQNSVIVVRR